MKRNWKRILSLWLTFCMVFTMNFGMGAVAVYADDPTLIYTAKNYTGELTITSGLNEAAVIAKANSILEEKLDGEEPKASYDKKDGNEPVAVAVKFADNPTTDWSDKVTGEPADNTEIVVTYTVQKKDSGDADGTDLTGTSETVTVTLKAPVDEPTLIYTAKNYTGELTITSGLNEAAVIAKANSILEEKLDGEEPKASYDKKDGNEPVAVAVKFADNPTTDWSDKVTGEPADNTEIVVTYTVQKKDSGDADGTDLTGTSETVTVTLKAPADEPTLIYTAKNYTGELTITSGLNEAAVIAKANSILEEKLDGEEPKASYDKKDGNEPVAVAVKFADNPTTDWSDKVTGEPADNTEIVVTYTVQKKDSGDADGTDLTGTSETVTVTLKAPASEPTTYTYEVETDPYADTVGEMFNLIFKENDKKVDDYSDAFTAEVTPTYAIKEGAKVQGTDDPIPGTTYTFAFTGTVADGYVIGTAKTGEEVTIEAECKALGTKDVAKDDVVTVSFNEKQDNVSAVVGDKIKEEDVAGYFGEATYIVAEKKAVFSNVDDTLKEPEISYLINGEEIPAGGYLVASENDIKLTVVVQPKAGSVYVLKGKDEDGAYKEDITVEVKPLYYVISTNEGKPTDGNVSYYYSEKPENVKTISDNFWVYLFAEGKEHEKAEAVKWSISDNDLEKAVSRNTLEMMPVSVNGLKATAKEGETSKITITISTDVFTAELDGTNKPVVAKANDKVKDVVNNSLSKALTVSFNGKEPESGTETTWFINNKKVDLNEEISLENFGLSGNQTYKVSGNVVIKKGGKTVSEDEFEEDDFLKVEYYEGKPLDNPIPRAISVNATGFNVTVENVSNNVIDAIAYPADTEVTIDAISKDFDNRTNGIHVFEGIAVKATSPAQAFANGTYKFFLRFARKDPEAGKGNAYNPSSNWVAYDGNNFAVKAIHDQPNVDDYVEKIESGKDSITLKIRDNADSNIKYILMSQNSTSNNAYSVDLDQWEFATKDGTVEFKKYVSANGTKSDKLEPGTPYKLFVIWTDQNGNRDSQASEPKAVSTKELGSLNSVELTLTATETEYAGKEKSISDNFTIKVNGTNSENNLYNEKDIKTTVILSTSANEMNVLTAPSSDHKKFFESTENGIPAGKYYVRAWATVSNDANKDNYSKTTVSSTELKEFTITPAGAVIDVQLVNVGNVSNNQVVAKKDVTFKDNVSVRIYSKAASENTITIDNKDDLTYTIGDKLLNKTNKSVSFDTAGTYDVTLSADAVKELNIVYNGEVSDNFVISKTVSGDTLEVINPEGLQLQITGNPLYYEAAQEEFTKGGIYVKLLDGTTELSKDKDGKYRNVTFTYSVSQDGKYVDWASFKTSNSGNNLKAGKTVYVSANYGIGKDVEYKTGSVTIEKQPIDVAMNSDGLTSDRNGNLKTEFTGTLSVSVYDYEGSAKEKSLLASDVNSVSIDTIFSASKLTLDTSKINSKIAGKYNVKATGATLKSELAENYTLVNEDITGVYTIINAFKLTVRDADKYTNLGDVPVSGSAKAVSINLGSERPLKNDTFYVKYGTFDNEGNPVYGGGEHVIVVNKADITENPEDSGSITISGDFITNFVSKFTGDSAELYVHTAEDTKAAVVTKGTKNPGGLYSVEYIAPVQYTGLKHVAGDDSKNNSKKNNWADLDVTVLNGETPLLYGVDYTLSYKNNTDAISETTQEKKMPQVIVTGKGAHKGLKITATFSILPASLENIAYISLKKPYVKLNGKVNVQKLGTLINTYTGKKLPGSFKFEAFDEDDITKEITDKLPTPNANKLKAFYVRAARKDSAKKNVNYNDNWTDLYDTVQYGIPKTSYKLTAKTLKNIAAKDYSGGSVSINSFFKDGVLTVTGPKKSNFTKLADADVKTLEKNLVGVYFCDKNGAKADPTQTVSGAGTYYIAVGPLSENSLSSNLIFEPTIKKVKLGGKSIKGFFTLDKANKKADFDGNEKEIVISATKKGANANTKDVEVYIKVPGVFYDTNEPYGAYAGVLSELNSRIKSVSGDNGFSIVGAGKYVVTLKGINSQEGIQTLTYTINALKAKNNVSATWSNGGTDISLSYNAAGYYYDAVKVTAAGKTLSENKDYYVTYKGANPGGKGTATITGTGTAFTGSVKLSFSVEKMNLSDFVLYEEGKGYHSFYELKDPVSGNSISPNAADAETGAVSKNSVSYNSFVKIAQVSSGKEVDLIVKKYVTRDVNKITPTTSGEKFFTGELVMEEYKGTN